MTCSHEIARQVRGCRGIRYRAARLRLYLWAGALTCSLPIKLRLAYVLCFIIRKLRYSLGFLSGFLQCGIPRHTCRFYCCLAAHQRTRKKDSAEPSFPILWTPPHPPGVIRCGGALLLPRAYRDIGSLYPVQTVHRQFRILFGYLCSGWYRSRFSRVAQLVSFVFHYWGGDRSCLRLLWVLQ